jgi:CDP-paratose 2-epimerase
MLRQAAAAPVERVYWYSVIDLDPSREAIEGFHADENEYHLGLVTWDGRPKPAFDVMRQLQAQRARSASAPNPPSARARR